MISVVRKRTIAISLAAVMVGLSLNAPTQASTAVPQVRGDVIATKKPPLPPRLPRNFQAVGRYYVPSLKQVVPFVWNARNGNVRMIAGGPKYKVWFTNVIFNNNFYTHTFKWPTPVPKVPCTPVPGLNLAAFNRVFARAHFVGPEILQGKPDRAVNHWRLSGSFGPFPLAESDIYVSQSNRATWWQLLHFGLQNIYAPDMDEWIKLTSFKHRPGRVTLPVVCRK